MTDAYQLEGELKLQKDKTADSYGYNATATAVTDSPVNIYKTATKEAAIDVFYPGRGGPLTEPGYTPTHADLPARVPADHLRASDDGRGVNATLSAPRRFVVDRQGSQQTWYQYKLRSPTSNRVKNLWIRPATLTNATHDVTATGYIEVPAIVTQNIQGAVASGLQNGKRTTVELPATAAVANRSHVTVRNISYSFEDENVTVQLQTDDGTPAAQLTENVISTDGHSGRATRNVTVGRGVFQAQSAG